MNIQTGTFGTSEQEVHKSACFCFLFTNFLHAFPVISRDSLYNNGKYR